MLREERIKKKKAHINGVGYVQIAIVLSHKTTDRLMFFFLLPTMDSKSRHQLQVEAECLKNIFV